MIRLELCLCQEVKILLICRDIGFYSNSITAYASVYCNSQLSQRRSMFHFIFEQSNKQMLMHEGSFMLNDVRQLRESDGTYDEMTKVHF